jgi:hypothetical protein
VGPHKSQQGGQCFTSPGGQFRMSLDSCADVSCTIHNARGQLQQIQKKAQDYSGFYFKVPNTSSEIGTTLSRARARQAQCLSRPAHRHEIRPQPAIGLLEGRHKALVFLRGMRGRIRTCRDRADHRIAHAVKLIVVDHIAGADELDAGVAEPALPFLAAQSAMMTEDCGSVKLVRTPGGRRHRRRP